MRSRESHAADKEVVNPLRRWIVNTPKIESESTFSNVHPKMALWSK